DVTYEDTTDDGHEGSVFGNAHSKADEDQDDLESESKRLMEHLVFLESLARMWAIAADIGYTTVARRETFGRSGQAKPASVSAEEAKTRLAAFSAWAARAAENRQGLLELLDAVQAYRVTPQGSDNDSMRNYDRR